MRVREEKEKPKSLIPSTTSQKPPSLILFFQIIQGQFSALHFLIFSLKTKREYVFKLT